MNGSHCEQVDEHRAILTIVADADVTVGAATKGILYDRYRFWLGGWTLQEPAVTALRLVFLVASGAAEGLVDVDHGIPWH